MQKFLIFIFFLPLSANSANGPKYKCRVEIQGKDAIQSLEIPYDSDKKGGTLTFEDTRAQKAKYEFYGDALKMQFFIKSGAKKDEWNSIAESVSSGKVRAAMLKGPPGILISCQSNQ